MTRNILIFGTIMGAIICTNMVYMVSLCYSNPDMEPNDVLGYAAMVIVFSLTFFAIRNYRNNSLNGIISFGHAFKTGAITVLLASTLYVVVWLFYYYLFVPDFIDKYTAFELKRATRAGVTDLTEKTAEMAKLKDMYQNPLLVVLITYMEVLPVGLVVALVSAAVLKKKPA